MPLSAAGTASGTAVVGFGVAFGDGLVDDVAEPAGVTW